MSNDPVTGASPVRVGNEERRKPAETVTVTLAPGPEREAGVPKSTVEIIAHNLTATVVIVCATLLRAHGHITDTELIGAWGAALGTSGFVVAVRRRRHNSDH